MNKEHSIIIIEDHPIMRNGLAACFAATKQWKVMGTASTLEEAKIVLAAAVSQVDVILLDIQLEDGWGLDIIPQLDEQKLPCNTVRPLFAVFSSFDNYAHVSAALGYRVNAYISKQRSESEILNILQDVLNGNTWIDEIVMSKFKNVTEQIELLTKREAEILTLIKRGLANKQIAKHLNITSKTVENHLSNIHDKTGLSRLDWMAM